MIKYKINNDTLEAEKIVDHDQNSSERREFKKKVHLISKEFTTCTKYYLFIKNKNGDILMNEIYEN